MNKVDSFKIRLYSFNDNQNNIFDLNKGHIIKSFLPRTSNLKLHPEVLMADPFLYVRDDTLYLFYEKQIYWKPATIEMTCTTDLYHWSKPITVLQEDFHLSYPFVFKHNGAVFMIPETHKIKEIRLYKANKTLTHFAYYKTLIKDNRVFVDSSLYFDSDKIYLFTTSIDSELNLRLYISDDIEGPYIEHIKSPIAHGFQYGRNGGGVISIDNQPYRINQNCLSSYGENLNVFRIEDITPDSYKEILYIENLFTNDNSFYKDGGHHFSSAHFKGKTIIATDAKKCRNFITAQFNTIIRNKVKTFISKSPRN